MNPTACKRARRALSPSAAFAVALMLASCGGGGASIRPEVVLAGSRSALPDEWAFHRLGANDGILDCTAEVDGTPATRFGFPIDEKLRVVPILLVVNLVADETPVRFAEETLQPVLFLENGVALDPIDPDDLRSKIPPEFVARFDACVFGSTFLQRSGNSQSRHSGYLLFAAPEGARMTSGGLEVLGASREAVECSLDGSLLRFSYTAGSGAGKATKTISVGTK